MVPLNRMFQVGTPSYSMQRGAHLAILQSVKALKSSIEFKNKQTLFNPFYTY